VTDDDLLVAAERTTDYLKNCPGFVRRRLARADDGTWLDHIEWRSMDEAQAAAGFGTSPLTEPFREAMDPASISLGRFTVRAAAD
jgi:hypothetical protein